MAQDLKKELKTLYNPSAKEVSIVDVPVMSFLMLDGEGDPRDSEAFAAAMEVLYSASYAVKFMLKRSEPSLDYSVMPLEGLWWLANSAKYNPDAPRDNWRWTLMIMQPDAVTAELVGEAIDEVRKKKDPVALKGLRFARYEEGQAAQIMHIGPYAEEAPTITRLHDFINQNGYQPRGKHHEIYLSDPRRTAPEKLRTILRQPIEL